MRKPIISMIVPVYNAEKHIEATVKSICAQTITNIQILLIDDCSVDNSFFICEKMAKEDNRIEVYRFDVNKGVSSARNFGLQKAKGAYIMFADADDLLDNDMAELLLSLMEEQEETDLAACGYYINHAPQRLPGEKSRKMERLECAKAMAGLGGSLVKGYVVNKLFKKEKITEHQLEFDESTHICEDLLFCQQYVWNCNVIHYDPSPKYHYMRNKESAMYGKVTERRMSVFDTYPKIMEVAAGYQNKELDELTKVSYWNHFVSVLKDIMKNPSREQKAYGDKIFPCIKTIVFDYLKNEYVTFKRKVLMLIIYVSYPFWRRLPASDR